MPPRESSTHGVTYTREHLLSLVRERAPGVRRRRRRVKRVRGCQKDHKTLSRPRQHRGRGAVGFVRCSPPALAAPLPWLSVPLKGEDALSSRTLLRPVDLPRGECRTVTTPCRSVRLIALHKKGGRPGGGRRGGALRTERKPGDAQGKVGRRERRGRCGTKLPSSSPESARNPFLSPSLSLGEGLPEKGVCGLGEGAMVVGSVCVRLQRGSKRLNTQFSLLGTHAPLLGERELQIYIIPRLL